MACRVFADYPQNSITTSMHSPSISPFNENHDNDQEGCHHPDYQEYLVPPKTVRVELRIRIVRKRHLNCFPFFKVKKNQSGKDICKRVKY